MIKELNQVMSEAFPKYRGCTIAKHDGKFFAYGQAYPTRYLAEKRIDFEIRKFNALIALQNGQSSSDTAQENTPID